MYKTTKFENLVLLSFMILIVSSLFAYAEPSGPTITFIANETKDPAAATLINTTGGSITTMALNATSQNLRWKAYVGNVTGTLTLDDAVELVRKGFNSQWGEFTAEGIVARPKVELFNREGKRIITKIKHKDFN